VHKSSLENVYVSHSHIKKESIQVCFRGSHGKFFQTSKLCEFCQPQDNVRGFGGRFNDWFVKRSVSHLLTSSSSYYNWIWRKCFFTSCLKTKCDFICLKSLARPPQISVPLFARECFVYYSMSNIHLSQSHEMLYFWPCLILIVIIYWKFDIMSCSFVWRFK
jgi:hypothetical protein